MARVRRLLIGLLFALGAPPALAAPLDAYGKLPSIEGMAISPDGAHLATIVTDGEKRSVQIMTFADRKAIALPAGDAKLRGVMWADPTHVVGLRSTTASITGFTSANHEFLMGFEYDLAHGTARALMDKAVDIPNSFGPPQVRTVDGHAALFTEGTHFQDAHSYPSLLRMDLDHESAAVVEQGSEDTDGFVLGADGQAVAQTTWDEANKRWTLKLKQNGFWHEVRAEQASIDTPSLMGLGRDGKSVLVGEKRGDDFIVRELSPDGKWSEPLPIDGGDPELIFDPAHHNLIGYTTLIGDEQRTVFFDPKDQQVWDLVQHAYPGQRVQLASWSDDRQKIVVRADSPTDGPGYALVDLAAHHADWLGNDYDKIGPDDISPRKAIAFKAADGTELTGYLTVPHGRDAKALPLVVLPHGGPQARDEPGFDWLAEGIASRGYAVLQVNYRGSDGFGEKFVAEGYGQWGRKMQTDLSDGVRYLAGQGIVDPKRVCIVGASYGGYAALAGPTLDPGVYRCAVSYAGPADLHAMVAWSQSHAGGVSERYWLRFMGAKSLGDPSLADISPTAHVQKVSVPVLLIHGKDDTVVPLEQSHMMANDMKAAGKPVEMVVLDSTDHWLTRGATRLAMLQDAMAFVEKNNPPN